MITKFYNVQKLMICRKENIETIYDEKYLSNSFKKI